MNSKTLEPATTDNKSTFSKGLEKKITTKKISEPVPKKEEEETTSSVPKKSVWAIKPKWLS